MAISGFLNALEKKIDLYDLYSAARDQALAELAKIAAVDTSGIAPMFERLEGKGDNALAKAAAFDFGMVTTLLTGLLTDCATATHTLDGQKGFDQVMGQIAKIADRDRDDLRMSVEAAQASSLKLDEVIAGFEPDIQRNVIAVAFKELFGCDLSLSNAQWVQKPDGSYEKQITDDNGMDRDAPNLRRFHDLMASLPESDTLGNDSFLSFERRGGIQTGSAFNFVSKAVKMHESEAKTSSIYATSSELELGAQDDLYKTKGGEPVSYFSWNTLHEVGHAVDDKLGFMSKHDGESNDTYGGWKKHGANVGEIARARVREIRFRQHLCRRVHDARQGVVPAGAGTQQRRCR